MAERVLKLGKWAIYQIIIWYALYIPAWIWFKMFYRIRVFGMKNIPRKCPLLYVSNHQCLLDPVIIGIGTRPRPFVSLGRKTLFSNPAFGWLIHVYRTISVDQEAGGDLKAMRSCIEALKSKNALVVFAEGSRTTDGHVGPFANGIAMIMKRAKPQIVPVAIEGGYDIWPRSQKKPNLTGKVAVEFGKPRSYEEVMTGASTQESLEALRQEIEQMRTGLREKMNLPALPPEVSESADVAESSEKSNDEK